MVKRLIQGLWVSKPSGDLSAHLYRNRTEGRAPERVAMNVNVDWDKRIARMKAARKRIGRIDVAE